MKKAKKPKLKTQMELITERRKGCDIKTRVVPSKKKHVRKPKFDKKDDHDC